MSDESVLIYVFKEVFWNMESVFEVYFYLVRLKSLKRFFINLVGIDVMFDVYKV